MRLDNIKMHGATVKKSVHWASRKVPVILVRF